MCAVLIRLGGLAAHLLFQTLHFGAILLINGLPNRKHIFPATISDFLHTFARFSVTAKVIKRECLANKGFLFFLQGSGVFYMSSFVFK